MTGGIASSVELMKHPEEMPSKEQATLLNDRIGRLLSWAVISVKFIRIGVKFVRVDVGS